MSFYTIAHLEIPQYIIFEKPLWYYAMSNPDGINKLFKELKSLTGYGYDNTHLKWSNIFGVHFTIAVSFVIRQGNPIGWEITLWDATGQVALGSIYQKIVDQEKDVLSDENYREMYRITENYVKGIIACSDCKTEIKKTEVAGNYFAGNYCKDCWERKWKAIEAKETYD